MILLLFFEANWNFFDTKTVFTDQNRNSSAENRFEVMKQARTDEMETRLGLRVLAYENITDRILFLRIGVTGDIMDDIERKVTITREEI